MKKHKSSLELEEKYWDAQREADLENGKIPFWAELQSQSMH